MTDRTELGAGVDHVWSNVRVFLPTRVGSACQLGSDRLGPHLGELADRAVVVGDRVSSGETWTGLRARPETTPFPDAAFDVVVLELERVTDLSPDMLREARRLVAMGGRLVVTTSRRPRPWASPPPRARSSSDDVVAALPNARRPAILVDRRRPDAARYFMRHVAFPYRAPGRHGIKARALQLRNRVAMIAPPEVVLPATPARIRVLRRGDSRPSALDAIETFLRSSWSSLGLPASPPDRWSPLVLAHRKTTTALVSVVLLGGEVPLVAKLPRYGTANAALQREAETLERVRGALRGPILESLPRPLGIHVVDGTEVLFQTVVAGRHLVAETASRPLSRRLLADQLTLMLGWSSRLQEASGRWTVVDDALVDETLVPLAEEAIRATDGDRGVESLLDRAIEAARSLRGTPVRRCVVHGDFWAGNVLVERGSIAGVVDWERAEVDGLPIWDPVKSVLDAAYHLDRYRRVPRRGPAALPRWGQLGRWQGIADPRCAVGFRAAAVDASWLADLARSSLTRAFIQASIPLGWLPVALPFHLIREFVHEDVSERSVASWSSVLEALARHPGTWADAFVGDRRGARTSDGPVHV